MGSLGAPGAKAVGRHPAEYRCGYKQRKPDREEVMRYKMDKTAVIMNNVYVRIDVENHIKWPDTLW
jgi:hypothetical protein